MKNWRIPLNWMETAMVEIEADTLDEAIDKAYDTYNFERPSGDSVYIEGSSDIVDTVEVIRSEYNQGQHDEIPTPISNSVRTGEAEIHYRPEVTEPCPHCDSEITLIWNPEEDGYQIHCPRCGAKIMLCSMCPMHGRCDWHLSSTGEEHCFMMDKFFKVEVVQTSRKTVFVKAADREEAEEKAYELCPGMDLEYVDETMDVTVDSDYTGHPYTGDGVVIIK